MFTFFHPGRTFPAISITGEKCELNCLHCCHHYLAGMEAITEPDELHSRLLALSREGGRGALISGGSTREGVVPLGPFIPSLARIKKETDLLLNVHAGFVTRKGANALAEAGVDVVSVDVVGGRETIQTIYGMNKGPDDYRMTLVRLREAGLQSIVPHVTVGLHHGRIYGEYNAIRVISQSCNADAVVINVMMPTKGTPMESSEVPPASDVGKVIAYAVNLIDAPVYLGCMRPKGDLELELAAEEAGVSGIVLPSTEGRREIVRRRETEDVNVCCAALPSMREELMTIRTD